MVRGALDARGGDDRIAAAIAVMRAVEAEAQLSLAAAEIMSGNHIALTARVLDITQLTGVPAAAFGLLIAVTGASGASDPAPAALEAALARTADAGLLLDCQVLTPRP